MPISHTLTDGGAATTPSCASLQILMEVNDNPPLGICPYRDVCFALFGKWSGRTELPGTPINRVEICASLFR